MPEKELNYITSREIAGSDDKEGGVYIDAFDAQDSQPPLKGWAKFKDGFKRADTDAMGIDPNLSEAEKIAILTANSPLSKSLKNRHLQMIAIGGSIGTGLFVGSGSSLHTGGPAGLIIAYILIGTMIYCTVQSLGELAVTFPVAGAFVTYNTRFIDPSWGFAMAWNYAMQWLVVLPLELVAAAVTIKFWDTTTNSAAFVVIFYVLIIAINFFGVRGYGEAEFIFSAIKVTAVIGFIILGIVLAAGGSPNGRGYIGGKYWQHPGAFANGVKGVITVFVDAAYTAERVAFYADANRTFDDKDDKGNDGISQVYYVIVKEGITPIDPDKPLDPNTPDVTPKPGDKVPGDPKQRTFEQLGLLDEVNRTINYRYANTDKVEEAKRGQEARPTVEQKLRYSRKGDLNKVTGEITYTSDWTKPQTLAEVVSPVIEGYVADIKAAEKVDNVAHDAADSVVNVVYTPLGKYVPKVPEGFEVPKVEKPQYPNDPTDPTKPGTPTTVIPAFADHA